MLRYILLILSLITVGSSVRASGPYRAMNAVELNLLDSLTEQYDLSIEDGPKKENARLTEERDLLKKQRRTLPRNNGEVRLD